MVHQLKKEKKETANIAVVRPQDLNQGITERVMLWLGNTKQPPYWIDVVIYALIMVGMVAAISRW